MKTSSLKSASTAAFTLVEIMVATTIASLVLGGTMVTFMFGFRTMYKDMERLETNATLRFFISQVSKETLDATEFYVFPTYESLDGAVSLTNDIASLQADSYGTFLAYGDCLVLVTRVTVSGSSNVRQIRIYYRNTTSTSQIEAVRFYEGQDYGTSGTSTSLVSLLNAIDLKDNPKITRSSEMVANARGRKKTSSDLYYPIFSTESASMTPTNDSVSINIEVINGSGVNNMLSSSSFNYTISPRK